MVEQKRVALVWRRQVLERRRRFQFVLSSRRRSLSLTMMVVVLLETMPVSYGSGVRRDGCFGAWRGRLLRAEVVERETHHRQKRDEDEIEPHVPPSLAPPTPPRQRDDRRHRRQRDEVRGRRVSVQERAWRRGSSRVETLSDPEHQHEPPHALAAHARHARVQRSRGGWRRATRGAQFDRESARERRRDEARALQHQFAPPQSPCDVVRATSPLRHPNMPVRKGGRAELSVRVKRRRVRRRRTRRTAESCARHTSRQEWCARRCHPFVPSEMKTLS